MSVQNPFAYLRGLIRCLENFTFENLLCIGSTIKNLQKQIRLILNKQNSSNTVISTPFPEIEDQVFYVCTGFAPVI